MRLLLLLPILAATALSAQSIEIYPGATSFTSRGSIGTGAGEVHQGFHESHWKGIGDTGAGAFINGLNIITQDQNGSTPEVYDLVLRAGTDLAGPDPLAVGEYCSVVGLSTPPSTVLTPVAWSLTTNFSTPCRVPPKGFLSAGVRFAPAAGWTADGQSVHASNMAAQQSGTHQQDHAWQIIGGVVTHPSLFRSWRIRLLVGTPILQNGVFATTTVAYRRGMGGMFPPPTTHGWSTHVDGGTAFAGGVTGIFMSPVMINPGFPVPGIRGNVYLGSPLIALATVGLSATGTADVSLLDPIGFYATSVHLQAILVDSGFTAIALSNVNCTTFQ